MTPTHISKSNRPAATCRDRINYKIRCIKHYIIKYIYQFYNLIDMIKSFLTSSSFIKLDTESADHHVRIRNGLLKHILGRLILTWNVELG